ncbi:MAG: DUF6134 family protein, partial [Pseudomonadota bacterium]
GPHRAPAAVRDPLPPEGVSMTYRVMFGGNEIGTQNVRIAQHDITGHVVVEHDTKLEVRILFAVAYTLEHRSREVWDGFTLKSLKATTVENGKTTVVDGAASDKELRIRSGDTEVAVPLDAVTSDSFWIAAATESSSVVNARTGDAATPQVTKLEDGRVNIKASFAHGPVEATVRYDGDFLAEAEIDDEGQTVKLVRVDG